MTFGPRALMSCSLHVTCLHFDFQLQETTLQLGNISPIHDIWVPLSFPQYSTTPGGNSQSTFTLHATHPYRKLFCKSEPKSRIMFVASRWWWLRGCSSRRGGPGTKQCRPRKAGSASDRDKDDQAVEADEAPWDPCYCIPLFQSTCYLIQTSHIWTN